MRNKEMRIKHTGITPCGTAGGIVGDMLSVPIPKLNDSCYT
jgi:hypothetical protein